MKSAFFITTIFFLPFLAHANVLMNEVAWMGTAESYFCEWVELYNNASTEADLSGWGLYEQDGDVLILSLTKKIPPNGYYLIERVTPSCPDPIPNVTDDAGSFKGSGFSDVGEILVLQDENGGVIDRVNAVDGWPSGDKDSKETMQKSGSGWITAPGTPKAQNAQNNQPPQESQNEGGQTSLPGEEQNTNSAGLIDKKQFRADAGGDTAAVVGVEKFFEGKGYDLDGRPLMNGDFLWNFGDGASARGRNVSHIFSYPGKYRVVFDASSGSYNASDTVLVEATLSPVSLSEIKPGKDGFVELWNDSEYELDISYWGIGNGAFIYYFPRGTRILPHAYLVIPFTVSSVEFPLSGEAIVYYPNNMIADSFTYGATAKDDESFHNREGVGHLGVASPGSNRFVARVAPSAAPNYESGITNYGAVAAAKESGVINDDAAEEIYEETEHTARQAASVASSGKSFYQHRWFWFLAALVLGIFSAMGVFVLRKTM